MQALLQRDHDPGCYLEPRDEGRARCLECREHAGRRREMEPRSPQTKALREHRTKELQSATVEACVLERNSPNAIRYRQLAGEELKELTAS